MTWIHSKVFEKQLDARLLSDILKRIINQVAQIWSAIVRQASVNLVNCNLFFTLFSCWWLIGMHSLHWCGKSFNISRQPREFIPIALCWTAIVESSSNYWYLMNEKKPACLKSQEPFSLSAVWKALQ